MMRSWTAIALLSVSWLFGLHYLQPPSWLTWAATIVAGVLLAGGIRVPLPGRRDSIFALAMLVPVVLLFDWPHRAAPLAIAAGLVIHLLPQRSTRLQWPARGAVSSGLILLLQGVVLEIYLQATARWHDLPWPLTSLIGSVASLVGLDAGVEGSTIAVSLGGQSQQLQATWALLLDPATLLFFASAAAILLIQALRSASAARWPARLRPLGSLVLVLAAWIPLRAGLMLALLAHRAAIAAPEMRSIMDQFFSPWLYAGLLAVPVLLAWRFVALSNAEDVAGETPAEEPSKQPWQYPAAIGLAALGMFIVAAGLLWEPVGSRKAGRVKVVERHSAWEPTNKPYDTTHFGEDYSYTYRAIYDYCSQFYEMSRLEQSESIDDETLRGCDVLVIKTPTARYTTDEVRAVVRYVDRGGGLLLVGDHTDVKKSSSYLNDICRSLGFKFRKDLLYATGDNPYEQRHESRGVAHPTVQHVPPMLLAVSCSIDPGASWGSAAMLGTGLWSLPPLYSVSNYMPNAEYRADLRHGAFVQLWAARHGQGRVLAWTDSTIHSNFSAFEPGKPELMLGMLEWLNRQSALDPLPARLAVRGLALLVGISAVMAGLRLGRREGISLAVLLAAGLLGGSLSSPAIAAAQRRAMPIPAVVRPMPCAVLDRTVSEVPLSHAGFAEKHGFGFALFEQWIPRLGYYTARRSGAEAFSGDLLVIVCPQRSVTDEYRRQLVDYVAAGGRLLVLDSPEVAGSTANSVLWPFGLTSSHVGSQPGPLIGRPDWPEVQVTGSCKISGGETLLTVQGIPAAAIVSYGEGQVLAVGFGSLLNDTGLGRTWLEEPDAAALARSQLLFALIRELQSPSK